MQNMPPAMSSSLRTPAALTGAARRMVLTRIQAQEPHYHLLHDGVTVTGLPLPFFKQAGLLTVETGARGEAPLFYVDHRGQTLYPLGGDPAAFHAMIDVLHPDIGVAHMLDYAKFAVFFTSPPAKRAMLIDPVFSHPLVESMSVHERARIAGKLRPATILDLMGLGGDAKVTAMYYADGTFFDAALDIQPNGRLIPRRMEPLHTCDSPPAGPRLFHF